MNMGAFPLQTGLSPLPFTPSPLIPPCCSPAIAHTLPRPVHAAVFSPFNAAAMAASPSFGWRLCAALTRKWSVLGSRNFSYPCRQQRRRASAAVAVAVWKQEVLWAEAPVVEVNRAAEQLFHVVLDVSANPELMMGHTKAGQFVQVRIEDSKPVFLAIASPPKTAAVGSLEFLIKYVERTTAGYLCGLGKGDKVELSQVMGNGFGIDRLYPAEEFDTLLLFATGSGISPVRSLIEAGFEAHKRSDVRLYYGARNLKRMAYQDKFKEWESSGVKIIPVLSQPGDSWSGEQGYVQAVFSKSKEISDPLQTGAVLSGHKEMAQDVTSLLVAEGVSQGKILKNF